MYTKEPKNPKTTQEYKNIDYALQRVYPIYKL